MRLIKFCLLFLTILFIGCNKLVDVPEPPDRYTNPFTNNVTANQMMLGIYELNLGEQGLFYGNLSRCGGLYAGEIEQPARRGDDYELQMQQLKAANRFLPTCWSPAYKCIARCNEALQALPKASGVDALTKNYLLGEAYFWRALSYFYLVNLWEKVPLVTDTDLGANSQIPQSEETTVYRLVLQDLEAAANLLPAKHPATQHDTLRRTRIELGAARALLARVSLYAGQYDNAAYYAGLVIDAGTYSMALLDQVFQYQSPETIFQLKPVLKNSSTAEASIFQPGPNGRPTYTLTTGQWQAFSASDLRAQRWTRTIRVNNQDRYIPYKYTITKDKPRQEYCIVLRLAEQYLIRAEARILQGDLAGARADLNRVHARADSQQPVTATTAEGLSSALVQERQAELFTEWGHRFLDLKRWWRGPAGPLHELAAAYWIAQPNWANYKIRWPIPHQELQKNPQLQQNEQY